MRKHISFAVAAAMLSLGVAFPAFAGDAVALIERLTDPSQRVELMTYAHVGQIIQLGADQTMVLTYRDTCIRETITGGTITIGTGKSEVRSAARLDRVQNTCGLHKADISRADAIGSRAFRGGLREPSDF